MPRPAHLRPEPPKQTGWDRATLVAFLFILALVAARALMMETIADPFEPKPGAPPSPRGCGPAAGLVLDLLACLPMLLLLGRRVFDKTYSLRPALSFLPLALLAVWAAASVAWSSDRFTAAVSVGHAVGAVAMMFAASQLVRSWTRLRVTAALGFALLLPYITHGLYYRYADLPELRENWKTQRSAFFADRGWAPDSFEAKQFEQKILADEMVGFHASPNTFAAVIVVAIVVGLGLALQRFTDGDGLAAILPYPVTALGGAWLLYYCHSKAAAVTPVIAIVLLALFKLAGPRLSRHWKLTWAAGVLGFLLVVAAVVAYGRAHGNLHNDSLNFRWRYWVASAHMVHDRPILGTGYANFYPTYLRYRLPAAAEEIKDPHDFAVRMFTELGVPGGVLVLLWLGIASWELARPRSPASPGAPIGMKTLIATVAVALIINLICSIDWGIDNDNFLFLEAVKRVLFFVALGAGLLIGGLRSMARPESDDRAAPWALAGIAVALFVFLLHNLIDFSAFEVGPMYTAALLLGAALGARTAEPSTRPAGPLSIAAFAMTSLALVAAAIFFVAPVIEAESHAHAADQFIRASMNPHGGPIDPAAIQSAVDHLDEAARLVPYNADYFSRAAHAMAYSDRLTPQILPLLDAAIATDPADPQNYLTRGKYEATQANPDWDKALADDAHALRLDPYNLEVRLAYAETLQALLRNAEAKAQYELLLHNNSLYDPTEPKRLSKTKVAEIEKTMESLGATSQPAR